VRSTADIKRLKARMGWAMPWYTITESFVADVGVTKWHGKTRSSATATRCYVPLPHQSRGDEAMGTILEVPQMTALGVRRSGRISRKATANAALQVWNWQDTMSGAR